MMFAWCIFMLVDTYECRGLYLPKMIRKPERSLYTLIITSCKLIHQNNYVSATNLVWYNLSPVQELEVGMSNFLVYGQSENVL